MDQTASRMLFEDARRYIWWETPAEAMLRPDRVIAQVMNMGDFDDSRALLAAIGEASFRVVLEIAEPGWFNERSWHYWHYALGVCPPDGTVPPLPARRFS
ncbi:hypothetical protein [Geothrix sp. 21YS21S-2]|uniref:hypothetical protein n=1 Tax=Geothrix sp. 21YS21S-2 TaxID=3068893 RepID=UPI0027BACEDB|nr:hypothetical protein [Geothrix sp. 21YS21S-2]